MDQIYLDFFSITIAAILYTIIYFFWHSKWLFKSTLIKHLSIEDEEFEKRRWIRLFWNFALGFTISFFIAFFEAHLGVTTVSDGMFVGFTFWLGFVVPTLLSPLVMFNRPIALFFVESGAKLLAFLVMGGIIGA
jgi:hypothetical protein